MKVSVNVRVAARGKEAEASPFSCAEGVLLAEGETAASLKERLAGLEAIPFPGQSLLLGGEVLADECVLSDRGVKDSDSLDFVVQASTETLAAQLAQLLKLRDVSCDELGLMYSYKFGASIDQALKLLGHEGSLPDFLAKQPSSGISVSAGVASLKRSGTGLRSFSPASEAEQLLRSSSSGSMEIKELCIRFANKFGVSLTSVTGVRPADFFAREKALFTIPSPGYVCLKGKKFEDPAAAFAAEDLPPGLAPPPGLDANAPVFQPAAAAVAQAPTPPKRPACKWFLKGECWEGDRCKNSHEVPEEAAGGGQDDAKYVELHDKIRGRHSHEAASEALDEVVEVLQEAAFLNVDRVAIGGSLAKGTAICGPAGVDAEVVFFLRALPANSQDRWMPPLLRGAGGVLAEKLEGEHGIEGVRATVDSVRFRVVPGPAKRAPPLVVDLRFSPAFGSYAEAAKAQVLCSPHTRRLFSASFVEERVQFIVRQPEAVKATIRLLKWWRDQQSWSSKFTHPPDEILEVLAAYSATQTKPVDLKAAVANVMSLFAHFDQLRVVWSDLYEKDDVWKPLLKHRPLLMDPVNPYVNIADVQAFDGRELSAAAKTTHFFW